MHTSDETSGFSTFRNPFLLLEQPRAGARGAGVRAHGAAHGAAHAPRAEPGPCDLAVGEMYRVTDAMDDGLVRRQDPLMAHLAIWTAVHGAATVLLLGPALGAVGEDRLANTLIDTVIRGLCTQKGIAALDEVGLLADKSA